MVVMAANGTHGDRAESPPFPLPSGGRGRRRIPQPQQGQQLNPTAGIERIYTLPAGVGVGVAPFHPPLQNAQSDSGSAIPKRKACIVKLDGCRFTIGTFTAFHLLVI